jgi:predicted phosphodiesterase
MRVLFVSDTHLGFDLPSRPRVVRRRRGDDFFWNFERALESARVGEVDVVVHGGDLLVSKPRTSLATPGDAVVQLRVTGRIPSTLTAATLRAVAGARTVTLAIRTADRRTGSFAGKTTVQ